MRIIVCDDEPEIRKVLRLLLESQNYEVTECVDGQDAVERVSADGNYDLCILDIMMPRMSGIEAARRIRAFSSLPILFLSARSLSDDKTAAYGSGGDDYIVKPFSARELMFKVEALIRRYNSYSPKPEEFSDGISVAGGVYLNPRTREVTKNGVAVDVRDKEMDVLIYLAKNRGRAVNAAELYEAVWEEMPLPSSGNTVTVHVLNLRRKLEDNPSAPKIIRTVWGRGYQID